MRCCACLNGAVHKISVPKKLKGLRLCLSAGAPLPAELSRACKDRLGLPIRTFYGASECGGVSYDRSRDGILPDGCVGTLLPGAKIPALTGNRVLYRDGLAVGALVAGETRWLEPLEPAELRSAETLLIRQRAHAQSFVDAA